MNAPHGLLNLNKPAGMTSRHAVTVVERLTRPIRAGHAGTLDPLATGVLVICIGAATRLIEYVQRMPKSYLGTFLLGRHSASDDVESEMTELADPPHPAAEEIARAAAQLTGPIMQRPPIFSALKVKGRRAYDLARKGRPVELAPRPVTIHGIELVRYDYPEVVLRIECSSGTYVRALGRDLAEALGTAAVMSALVRTAVGTFHVEEALDPTTLTASLVVEQIVPAARAVSMLPQIVLSADEAVRIGHGLAIAAPEDLVAAPEIAALDEAGELVSILRPRGPGLLGVLRNMPKE